MLPELLPTAGIAPVHLKGSRGSGFLPSCPGVLPGRPPQARHFTIHLRAAPLYCGWFGTGDDKTRTSSMKSAPSTSDPPSGSRIATIKSSLSCFVCSLIGLVPLVGIPFAVAAVVRGRQTPGADRLDWNPADRYLRAARWLGPLGFLTSATFIFLLCFVLPALWRDLGFCSVRST
jgi:hypothetical protein